MRLHCAAAWSRPGARPFSPLRAPWALGRAAPGARSGSFGTGAVKRPPRAAPGSGSSHASRRLRPGVPLSGPASASRPPPVLGSVVGGPGPGLWAPGGPGVRPLLPPWAVWPPCSLRFRPPPPLSPCGGCRRRCFSSSGDVASCASLGSWVRPGRDGRQVLRSGCADAKTSPGFVPLNDCFPCPSSFAV